MELCVFVFVVVVSMVVVLGGRQVPHQIALQHSNTGLRVVLVKVHELVPTDLLTERRYGYLPVDVVVVAAAARRQGAVVCLRKRDAASGQNLVDKAFHILVS